ncbi:MAG: hypothetical protein PHX27_00130 [Candidatus ainarchaeum sp.]|nr:hypothetical protein [Candidatus ainarchaeum sp.]
MDCKCNELRVWLKKEISHLEEVKQDVSFESTLGKIIDAKIFSYLTVLNGLE